MTTSGFEIHGLDVLKRRLAEIGNAGNISRIGVNALRRGGRRIISETIRRQKQRGVLRTVFAKNATGLRKIVKAGRPEKISGFHQITLSVKGLAAIQETGGRTKPHLIQQPWGRRTGPAQHPGAQHPQISAFVPEVERGKPLVLAEVQKALTQYLEAGRG